jgi:murein DD-endopeptidase MepM/ murein hydrolase activator NlpD
MRKEINLILEFVRAWKKYLGHKSFKAFHHFEGSKNVLVEKLTLGRGKLVQPFVHSGMAALLILGLALAPLIASSYPGFAQNPWEETPPPSAVLSSMTEADPQATTLISEKPRSEVLEYQVQTGETVSGIANKFGISIDTIRWANNLSSVSAIKPGQTLKILPITGVLHKVKKGETIYSIAKYYATDAQGLVDFPFNTFVNDETFALAVGQTLIVPDGTMPKETPWSPASTYIAKQTPNAGTVVASGQFIWPASGVISQRYSWYHPAVDIANRASPDILAADAGTVTMSGWSTGGFGNRIQIDHGNGYKTNYGHFVKIYVAVGQTVKRGDPLGQMGTTGRSTGIHLDFRIYKNGVAVDPLQYLK